MIYNSLTGFSSKFEITNLIGCAPKFVKYIKKINDESSVEKFLEYIENDKDGIVSSFYEIIEKFNLSDDENTFLAEMAKFFKLHIENYYTNDMKSINFESESEYLISLYFYDVKDSENECHILYRDNNAKLNENIVNIVESILDCKIFEAKIVKSVLNGTDISKTEPQIDVTWSINKLLNFNKKSKYAIVTIRI